jgi:hypothetical protein
MILGGTAMVTTFDLPSISQFAKELDIRRRQCHGEGTYCSDLDEMLSCQANVCQTLREAVNEWAKQIYTGKATLEPEVEAVFLKELHRTLELAIPVLTHAQAVSNQCFQLEHLTKLQHWVRDFTFLLENWASPRRAVSPAARVPISQEADAEIRQRIADLPGLPNHWRPTDPRQARIFRQQPPAER